MKTIIVTAANEKFASLVLALIHSLRQWGALPCDAIGVLDVGFSKDTLAKVQGLVTHVANPAWDLPCNSSLRERKPFLRAYTARPFLPKYFPGYDIYLWLDADTLVQEKYALDWLFQAANQGELGIVPQVDRCYVHTLEAVKWRAERVAKYYGDEGLALFASETYYNTGAFSLRGDAPHWHSWAGHFRRGLESSPLRFSDQTALNYAIWKDTLPVHPLPALCNWCCHLAAPKKNHQTGKLCEPRIPHRPIGVLHMTTRTKGDEFREAR